MARPSPNNPKDQPCTRCGRPSFKVINYKGTREFRCFPHAVQARGFATTILMQRLKQEESYILDHIDVGFPYVSGNPWESRSNATREDAWGANQLKPTAAQRIGLDR